MDQNQIENIYLRMWAEKGEMGGPRLWFEVIEYWLASEGYEIKEGTPELGD